MLDETEMIQSLSLQDIQAPCAHYTFSKTSFQREFYVIIHVTCDTKEMFLCKYSNNYECIRILIMDQHKIQPITRLNNYKIMNPVDIPKEPA